MAKVFVGDGADAGRGPRQREEQEQKQLGRRCAATPPGRRRHPAGPDGHARAPQEEVPATGNVDPKRPRRASLTRRRHRSVRNRHHAGSGKDAREAQGRPASAATASVLPLSRGGHRTQPTVSRRPSPIPRGPAPARDSLPLARRPPRRRDVRGQVEVRLAPSSHWTQRSGEVPGRVTFLASHPSRAPRVSFLPGVCPATRDRPAGCFCSRPSFRP